MREKLTIDLWRGLVANHLRRAWESQWSETTDREMDYAGERLIEDKWSVSRATWAVREVVRRAYSPKGFLKSITDADAGDKDRNTGELRGGWYQSAEYRVENRAEADATKRNDCYSRYTDDPDWEPRCARQHDYCGECPGVKSRYRGKGGEFASVGAMAEKILKGGN